MREIKFRAWNPQTKGISVKKRIKEITKNYAKKMDKPVLKELTK